MNENITPGSSRQKTTANLATIILAGLCVFQFLLLLGLPLGEAAWGGKHRVLPFAFRVGSSITIVVYLAAILAIRTRAGLRQVPVTSGFARRGTWFFGIFFLLGGLPNFVSSSPWERYLLAPISIVLGLMFIGVAGSKSVPVSQE